MLLNLEILNGEMSPTFDKYVNDYTVNIKSDIDKLVLNYEFEKDSTIEIIGNETLKEGTNFVYIEVKNNEEINTYTLEINKEKSESVIKYEEFIEPLEVEQAIPEYIHPLIIGSCALAIIILFFLIFHKRKNN